MKVGFHEKCKEDWFDEVLRFQNLVEVKEVRLGEQKLMLKRMY